MKVWKKLVLAAATFVALGTATALEAQEATKGYPDEAIGYENLWECMSRKLGRGISNVAFSPLEILVKIADSKSNYGGIAAVTQGPITGVGYTVARIIVGATEIVTFPFPLPWCPNDTIAPDRPASMSWGYGPILEPEWIITPSTNYLGFVY